MGKRLATVGIAFVMGIGGGYFIRDISEPQQLETTVQKYHYMEAVKDGDTFVLREPVDVPLDIIRIMGINTPEKGEPLYNKATETLEELIAGKELYFKADPNSKNKVSYDRAVLWPFYDDKDGKQVNVAVEMVRQGYAEVLLMRRRKNSPLLYEIQLLEAQKEAQQSRRGIWAHK